MFKEKTLDKPSGLPKDVSMTNLVSALIEHANSLGASDIHIEPNDSKVRIRLRVDGVLEDLHAFPKTIHSEIISRIKVLSSLRTDEHQAAQDGRFRSELEKGGVVDVRVSIAPTYYGENAVLRLLSDRSAEFSLEMLGLRKPDREKIEKAMKKRTGMILATGPTGSGKTTTLYTLMKMLNTKERSLVTIEDPIEYAIEGVEQIQVNSRTGLTFAGGLKTILRQDPNIIMVGEIRDSETAGIAVNTALTGHLLLSTLHTNDSATTLPRLLDMKIESYLVASTVNVAIAQRLVRKICSKCKIEKKMTAGEVEALSEMVGSKAAAKAKSSFVGKGCEDCNGSGFSGRIGIYEVLVAEENIRDAIIRKASAAELKKIAIQNGMTTMLEDGFEKVAEGMTTPEEVLQVVHE